MSKFKKKSGAKQEIPTSALPDIIFMLLFFFMVTTVLRETTIMVNQEIPKADQLRKLQRKSLVSYLHVGKPKASFQARFGTEPLIQANDVFVETDGLIRWVNEQRSALPENERELLTVALKVDSKTKRGIISDIELELRRANARRLLYSTIRPVED